MHTSKHYRIVRLTAIFKLELMPVDGFGLELVTNSHMRDVMMRILEGLSGAQDCKKRLYYRYGVGKFFQECSGIEKRNITSILNIY